MNSSVPSRSRIDQKAHPRIHRRPARQEVGPSDHQSLLCDGRSALSRAKRESEITSVPFIPTVEVGEPKERALTLDQMAIIFDNVKSDHLVMFCLVMANTMARPEAVLELTRFQLDFESKLVRLNPEGRKQTKKYRPTVPMTNTLLPWLQKAKTNYVITYHGDRVYSVKKTFQRLPKVAKGLPERISPYCIRHTMAKELRRRGVPPGKFRDAGPQGAGLRTTEIYAKYDPSYLSAARIAIDEVMADIDAKMNQAQNHLAEPAAACRRECRTMIQDDGRWWRYRDRTMAPSMSTTCSPLS